MPFSVCMGIVRDVHTTKTALKSLEPAYLQIHTYRGHARVAYDKGLNWRHHSWHTYKLKDKGPILMRTICGIITQLLLKLFLRILWYFSSLSCYYTWNSISSKKQQHCCFFLRETNPSFPIDNTVSSLWPVAEFCSKHPVMSMMSLHSEESCHFITKCPALIPTIFLDAISLG